MPLHSLRDSLWVAALLVCGQPALADVVILKDGFTLHGKVRRESTQFVDPASGQMLVVPKGFFMLDDEAPRIYFNHRQIPDASNNSGADTNRDADQIRLGRPFTRASNWRVPPGRYAGVTPWDDKWQRDLTLDLYPSGKRKIEQSLTILTPYF